MRNMPSAHRPRAGRAACTWCPPCPKPASARRYPAFPVSLANCWRKVSLYRAETLKAAPGVKCPTIRGPTKVRAPRNALAEQRIEATAAVGNISSPFGQNEWLVEEMYRKFRDDPSSVDPSWHEFLVDYNPDSTSPPQETANTAAAPPAAAAHPKPAPAATPPAAVSASAKPAEPTGNGAAAPAKAKAPAVPQAERDELQVLRGAAAAVVKNMSASLDVPTATR